MRRSFAAMLAVAVLAACGGKPAVPDEQQTRDYASTKEGTAPEAAQPEITVTETTSTTAPKATGPVATVNGKSISAEEFNTEIERGVSKGMQPGLLRQLSEQLVAQLVDRTLINGAIESSNIKVEDDEIAKKLDEVRAEFAKVAKASGQESSLEAATKAMGITQDELRESIVQAIAIEKVLEARGFKEPTQEEIKKFYDDNKMRFERPEQVHLRHILVKVEKVEDKAAWDAAEKKAKALRAELAKDGADFAKAAAESSDGPMAATGGDLGFRERGVLPEEIDAVAFQMKKGELSKPVKSSFGWHILKLEDRADGGVVAFDEIADQLKSQMKTEAVNGALMSLLSELRESAKVERHPENIQ